MSTNPWYGDTEGHRRAALLGWARRRGLELKPQQQKGKYTSVGWTRFETDSDPERLKPVLTYGAKIDRYGDILVPTEYAWYLEKRLGSAMMSVMPQGTKARRKRQAAALGESEKVHAEYQFKSYQKRKDYLEEGKRQLTLPVSDRSGDWEGFSDYEVQKEIDRVEKSLEGTKAEYGLQWKKLKLKNPSCTCPNCGTVLGVR